ncbi:hypothetical protein CRENBAI_024883 [Crenichthys baileyi]|uniref:Uncharacterized protein n=1 Tax=Crenichthys baileyi TaxID=28760 RepID=A0AAV9RHI2_9TELE
MTGLQPLSAFFGLLLFLICRVWPYFVLRFSFRASWNFGVPLFVAVSITAMISVASVLGAVCCKVKAKRKKSKIFGETLCESWKQEALETSGIIYATVDFKPHQKPEEVYANLGDNKTGAGIPNVDNAGMVEYSMLAIQL